MKKTYVNESDLSAAIVKKLNSYRHVKCQKIKASAYGHATLDIVGSKSGMFFWLEVKQPGAKPTARQNLTMRTWIERGAVASWTNSVNAAITFLLTDWSTLTEEKMLEGFRD